MGGTRKAHIIVTAAIAAAVIFVIILLAVRAQPGAEADNTGTAATSGTATEKETYVTAGATTVPPGTDVAPETTDAADAHEHEEFSAAAGIDPLSAFSDAALAASLSGGEPLDCDAALMERCYGQGFYLDAAGIWSTGAAVSENDEMAGDAVVFFDEAGNPTHCGVMAGRNTMAHIRDGAATLETVSTYGSNFSFCRLLPTEGVPEEYITAAREETGFVRPVLTYAEGVTPAAFDNRETELALLLGDALGDKFPYRLTECEITMADPTWRQGWCRISAVPAGTVRSWGIMYEYATGQFSIAK